MKKIYGYLRENALFLAWAIAAASVAGSMALSEVMDLPPCNLCWWQRIFMFSAAIVLTVGLYYKDRLVYRYVLPLAIGGLLFSGYHSLLQIGMIKVAPVCGVDESCTVKQLELLGFITIPMMAFAAFAALVLLLYIMMKNNRSGDKD